MTVPAEATFNVLSGQIHIQTRPEHERRISLLPKGIVQRDEDYGTWTMPATSESAAAIREAFKGVGVCNADRIFRDLLQATTNPVPLKPAKSLLKTDLWPHQRMAVEFVRPLNGAMLAHDMGCVAGDTMVTINRGGAGKTVPISHLHHKFTGGGSSNGKNVRYWDLSIPTYVRALKADGTFGKALLVATYDRGEQPCIRVTLASGKSITVTRDHDMVTPDGKRQAGALSVGDGLLTNGEYIDKDGYIRVWGTGHPREGTGGMYQHILVAEEKIGRMLEPGEVVHHINQIKSDNRPENLQVMWGRDHLRLHSNVLQIDTGNGVYIPKVDLITSIEDAGVQHVYDLTVDEPAHTFVANGIVVGNSGKTLSTIALILERGHQKTVIFAPKRVLSTWEQQVEIHTGGLLQARAFFKGSVQERMARAEAFMNTIGDAPVILVFNYESIDRKGPFRDWLLKQGWDLIVLDESHRIKDAGGVRSKWLNTLGKRIPYRLCLTGTPMPHSPLDIYAQYRFLDPRIFGTNYAAFKARYADMNPMFPSKLERMKPEMEAELHSRMYMIAHRVETADVVDLPERTVIEVPVELEPKAIRHYQEIEEMFWTEVDEGEVTVANALVKLLRLQQITGGWMALDEAEPVRVSEAKARALGDILQDIPADEPVVVFAQFHRDLDAIHQQAARAGRRYGEISGRRGEDDYIAWGNGNIDLIGIQIQAGGEGLNDLVRSRHAIYYSTGFSLGRYNQSRARVLRPGQKNNVIEMHLIAQNTIDEKVVAALRNKQEVVDAILKGR